MEHSNERGDRRKPTPTIVPSTVYAAAVLPVAAVFVLAHTPVAQAQTAIAQAVELPPVVVEGATLTKPKQKPLQPKAPVTAADDDESASPAKKPKKSAAKKPAPASASASVAPAAAPSSPAPVPFEASATAAETGTNAAGSEATGVRADTVGTALTVVTGEEIRAQQSRTAVDVLRSLPGVSVSQQGGAGNVAVVRIRGAESNHTLVVIDGVEANSSIDGLYDFANLATDDIERIEVLRGPQSGIYGSGALGGVVNIVTKSGKGPATLVAEGEGGSYGTRAARAGVSGGTDTAWGSFMVASRKTEGFDISPIGIERDGSALRTLSLKAGVRPFENFSVKGSFRASELEGDRDDFSFDLPGYQMAVDAAHTFDNKLWSGRVDGELSLFGGAWTQAVFLARSKRDFTDVSFSESRLIDETTKYGYQTTVRIGPAGSTPVRHFITGLIERQEETFDQPTAADFHAERGRTSLVGEVRGEYFDHLFLGATLRRDNNETFDDTTDWRVHGSLKVPSTPFRLHASYGTGTKLPSFVELYGTFFRYIPNPDLKPEQSKGWDAGIETTFLGGRGVLDVTYFKADLTSEITEDFSNFPFITSVNLAGESRRQGIEVSGRLKVLAGVTIGAAYTWLDATDDIGEKELRRPPHQGRFDVDWVSADRRARLNFAAIYNGRTPDIAFLDGPPYSERLYLDEYWLLRLAGSYELSPGVEMFGRVENLLDSDYQEIFGYQTAGIAAYAGLRIKLEAPLDRGASLK